MDKIIENYIKMCNLCFYGNNMYSISKNIYYHILNIFFPMITFILTMVIIYNIIFNNKYIVNITIIILLLNHIIYITLYFNIDENVEYIIDDEIVNIFKKYYVIPEYCNMTQLCVFEDKLYNGCDINHLIPY
jgi:hypothetical protein